MDGDLCEINLGRIITLSDVNNCSEFQNVDLFPAHIKVSFLFFYFITLVSR